VQPLGGGAAKAARRSGDDRHAAGEISVHASVFEREPRKVGGQT
jgi:hypothetical protein